jgi:TolB-like protein
VEPTPIRSVAVLPLDDLSSDEVGGYLSFGMTEALITELAKLGDLSVISRTSVTPYETTDLSIRQIAAELGVDGIIEGSVLRSGERVRVTAQLIDARSDTHIWAESYDRDVGDVLALQAELARAIAHEVQVKVSPAPAVGAGSARPISPAAYEAYLKGYYFQMKRTREDTLRAVRYFLKVIELEPNHPLGYSGLADEYSCAPTHSWSLVSSELWPSVPHEMIARARSNAQRALELDPASGPAHTSIALVHLFGNWDWSAAEAEFLKALELSPGSAWAHSTYAYLLAFQRRFDEAIVHVERARALDPLRVETTMDMAALQVWMGNRDEAYRFWMEAEEIMPGYAGLHQAVITGFCGTERHAEALAVLEGASAKYPEDPPIIGETAYCHAVAGDAPRARELLAELDGLAATLYVSPVSLAMVHVGLGDHDRAFEELKRGIRGRDFLLPYIGVDGTWDPLRADPRFSELLDHIGLPQASAHGRDRVRG